jgi:hypothetical protein
MAIMKISRRTWLTLLLGAAFVSLQAQAKVLIADAKQNFGFVKKGVVVKLNYQIENTGNEPLLISDVEVACSCTSVEFDKKPVLPHQTTQVIVFFDTQTVYDRQDRIVLVHSNDKSGPHKLRYKGVVLTK